MLLKIGNQECTHTECSKHGWLYYTQQTWIRI